MVRSPEREDDDEDPQRQNDQQQGRKGYRAIEIRRPTTRTSVVLDIRNFLPKLDFIRPFLMRPQNPLRLFDMLADDLQLYPAKRMRIRPVRPDVMLVGKKRGNAFHFEPALGDVGFHGAGEGGKGNEPCHPPGYRVDSVSN